jgi:hypothetical protein
MVFYDIDIIDPEEMLQATNLAPAKRSRLSSFSSIKAKWYPYEQNDSISDASNSGFSLLFMSMFVCCAMGLIGKSSSI